MATDRTAGRPGGRKGRPAARPAPTDKETLHVKMPAELYWRLKSYAPSRRTTVTRLVVGLIESELGSWYTARRGDGAPEGGARTAPDPGPPAGPLGIAAEPPADGGGAGAGGEAA